MTGNPLILHLESNADGDGIEGRLRDGCGEDHRFTGWLGLLSLLEQARLTVVPESPSGSGTSGRGDE
jgi:hypothetical protein